MAYVNDRVVHDADSHVMELPNWLDEFGTSKVVEAFNQRFDTNANTRFNEILAQHDDPQIRARDAEEVMARKNHAAIGAFRNAERTLAIDLIGINTQLVFPTTTNVWLEELEHGDNVDLLYETASATNRSQVELCEVDSRLLPVDYIPIHDLERAPRAAEEAIDLGIKALLIPWACPKHRATSHLKLDEVWSRADEAGIPVVFHVGLADRVLPKAHKINGLPPVPDFHGGDENFRSISYMAIPHGPMQALSMLILDGVLDRFEALKIGVIELGASWVPGFMRQLDSASEAFSRHETRLQDLKLKPLEYITRQVRVTPYPTEDASWIIEQSSPSICMFSTDYPHIEGGRNPYGRFQKSTARLTESDQDRFFRANFENLMGAEAFANA